MKNHMRSAPRYATKTPDAYTLQDEEHLHIIEELLNKKDAEFTDDECDNSVELENFNFKLNN